MYEFSLSRMHFEVTAQCNLKCTHCYTESGPHEKHRNVLTLDQYKAVARDAYALGARYAQVIGGEPAMWIDTPNLLIYLREIGFDSIEYYSNLTLLPKKVLDALHQTQASVAFTLMSHKPEIHDAITLAPGSWHATVENVKTIVKTNAVRASTTAFPHTADDIEETVRFLKDLGVYEVRVDRVRSVGRALEVRMSMPGDPSAQRSLEALAEQLCGACVEGSAYVSVSGDLHFCGFAREKILGNVLTQRLSEVISSGLFSESHQALKMAFSSRTVASSPRCSPEANYCPPGACGPIRCGPCGPTKVELGGSPRCSPEANYCPPGPCGPVKIEMQEGVSVQA